jgi:hypothetical protein
MTLELRARVPDQSPRGEILDTPQQRYVILGRDAFHCHRINTHA